jgi:hypothetical protein
MKRSPAQFIPALVVSGALLTGCAAPESTAQQAKSAIPADVSQAINEAVAAREKAGSVGGEWRDTSKIIGKAKAAAKAGEYDKAKKLAHQARREGELGHAQVMHERRRFDDAMRRGLAYW